MGQSMHVVLKYWEGGPPVDPGYPDSSMLHGNEKYRNSHWEQNLWGSCLSSVKTGGKPG